jgi:predicted enzyme related to lactoylglutathione lyase
MITGLRGTSIWSQDLNNLLPFYRDVLGLTSNDLAGDWKRLKAAGDGTIWIATLKDPEGNLVQLLQSARAA